jgi:N6-adenosine-specific RNA methylase IME4
MTQLVKYEAACRAIAAAKNIDEVKKIRDVSIAMKAYARQAKNLVMEADALEIRMRATRRMDQMRQDQKKTVGLAKGAARKGVGKRGVKNTPHLVDKPTLAETGIDKNLAKEGRKLGALSDREFEKSIVNARTAISSVVKSAMRNDDKKKARSDRETSLAKKQMALPDARYGVIVADPEWRFEPWSRETGMDRSADNHYPTSVLEVIKARDVASISAPDCILFLWATVPMLPHALAVMAAWQFNYVSHYVWNKDRIGTGYWNRNKHELLLIGTRGKIPAPAPGTQWNSVIDADIGAHSAKPECFLEMIEIYFPNIPKIELNRRGSPRSGWMAWGLEAEAAE